MTTISTQSLSGGAVTFSGIPSGFSRLVLDIDGMSFAANGIQARYEFSSDGVNFTTPAAIGPGFAASVSQNGQIVFETPDAATGLIRGAQGQVPASGVANGASIAAVRSSGGAISAIRVTPSGGSTFDGGTMTLSGE